MSRKSDLPPFLQPEPMIVMTVRVPRETRQALKRIWKQDDNFESISQVIQKALNQFIDRHNASAA